MALQRRTSTEKKATRVKREKKEKVKKEKLKKEKKVKAPAKAKKQETLIIDGIGYRTQLTKKYQNRNKYENPDPRKITAFIPGTILEIFVKTGQKVEKGDALLILEAMKMNNKLVAPQDASIKKILVKSGDMVMRNQLLVELK